jgi:hypothetical protein
MKKENLCGKIASQPSLLTLNGEQNGIIVFFLIEIDGKYYKLCYRDTVPANTFSNILVSSVGDDIRVEVSSVFYSGAREIKHFINYTKGLFVTI